jgi:hypothetical protein
MLNVDAQKGQVMAAMLCGVEGDWLGFTGKVDRHHS